MLLHALDTEPADGAPRNAIPVVLLHGLFGRARNLGALGRALAGTRRVLALDLRNHGDSPHGPLALDALAADVVETVAAILPGRVALFGHSLGGKVAMRAALSAPARCAALLVADIAPVAEPHGNAALADALVALPIDRFRTRADADRALASAVPDAASRNLLLQNLDTRLPMRWRCGLGDIGRGMGAAEGWAPPPDGARFDGPTLFLRGGRSDYLRPDHMPAIRCLFPRAVLDTIDDAGHWLHVERPDAFNAAAAAFLDAALGADAAPPG